MRVYGQGGFALVELLEDGLYVHGIFATRPVPYLTLLDDPEPPPSER